MTTNLQSDIGPAVLKHAKLKFEEGSQKGGLQNFLKQLASPEYSQATPIKVDTSHDLAQYFISSSHNTYLTGNQLYSKSSTDPYKEVLNAGCRCIEIDVWDGGSPSATTSSSSSDAGDPRHHGDSKNEAVAEDGDPGGLSKLLKKGLGRLRSGSGPKDEPPKDGRLTDGPKGPKDAPEAQASSDKRPLDEKLPGLTRVKSVKEPCVYHGYTATKDIPFRDICEVVRDHAFVNSDLPLVVSLEVHCGHEQQQMMVDIMQTYWKQYLVQKPKDFSNDTPLPSLASLKKKILIKVKFFPQKQAAEGSEQAAPVSSEANSTDEEEDQLQSKKKVKIIESLSDMGVYTRSCHFDRFSQPEAQIPTHIFSLSENKFIDHQEHSPESVFEHNLRYLMRAYPKGTRVRSTNLAPAPFWRLGVQMVALNWQQNNAAMMMNHAMFEGTGGWVLKPEGYRAPKKGKEKTPIQTTNFDLSIQLFGGQKLDPSSSGTPNVYLKCQLHVGSRRIDEVGAIPDGGKNKGGEIKRRSTVRHSKDPDFGGEKIEFTNVENVALELCFLRIKVMDDESAFQKDRRLGWVCFRLDRLPQGLRLFQVNGADSEPTGGSILVDCHLTPH